MRINYKPRIRWYKGRWRVAFHPKMAPHPVWRSYIENRSIAEAIAWTEAMNEKVAK